MPDFYSPYTIPANPYQPPVYRSAPGPGQGVYSSGPGQPQPVYSSGPGPGQGVYSSGPGQPAPAYSSAPGAGQGAYASGPGQPPPTFTLPSSGGSPWQLPAGGPQLAGPTPPTVPAPPPLMRLPPTGLPPRPSQQAGGFDMQALAAQLQQLSPAQVQQYLASLNAQDAAHALGGQVPAGSLPLTMAQMGLGPDAAIAAGGLRGPAGLAPPQLQLAPGQDTLDARMQAPPGMAAAALGPAAATAGVRPPAGGQPPQLRFLGDPGISSTSGGPLPPGQQTAEPPLAPGQGGSPQYFPLALGLAPGQGALTGLAPAAAAAGLGGQGPGGAAASAPPGGPVNVGAAMNLDQLRQLSPQDLQLYFHADSPEAAGGALRSMTSDQEYQAQQAALSQRARELGTAPPLPQGPLPRLPDTAPMSGSLAGGGGGGMAIYNGNQRTDAGAPGLASQLAGSRGSLTPYEFAQTLSGAVRPQDVNLADLSRYLNQPGREDQARQSLTALQGLAQTGDRNLQTAGQNLEQTARYSPGGLAQQGLDLQRDEFSQRYGSQARYDAFYGGQLQALLGQGHTMQDATQVLRENGMAPPQFIAQGQQAPGSGAPTGARPGGAPAIGAAPPASASVPDQPLSAAAGAAPGMTSGLAEALQRATRQYGMAPPGSPAGAMPRLPRPGDPGFSSNAINPAIASFLLDANRQGLVQSNPRAVYDFMARSFPAQALDGFTGQTVYPWSNDTNAAALNTWNQLAQGVGGQGGFRRGHGVNWLFNPPTQAGALPVPLQR